MEYRENRRTGDRISVIAMGSAYISEAGEKTARAMLETAVAGGVNYFDMAAGSGACFPWYGDTLSAVRDKIRYQIHFGADYSKISYGWTTDPEAIRRSIDWQLHALRTDYIDYGFIHCIDEDKDWAAYQKGALALLLDMKKQGVVRHIGVSSHTPSVLSGILDTGLIDQVMFSLNPGYDWHHGEYAYGGVDERAAIYRRCERDGIGISVMKPFSGGQLLDKRLSPFGEALTVNQCLQYVLDTPAVLTAVCGAASVDEVKALLSFSEADQASKDYAAIIGRAAPDEARGKCVYCNHCQPCPAGLDIAQINKYYDLYRVGDGMALDHYRQLAAHADACLQCGHCNQRCPFGVDQMARMREIAAALD